MLRAFGATDKGPIRPTNEDCFAIREDLGLLIVADGMGGHQAGEVASQLAVRTVVTYFEEQAAAVAGDGHSNHHPFGTDAALGDGANELRTAILLANAHILELSNTNDEYAGMGTTIVAARVAPGSVAVAHVGDSRLYVHADDVLRQVTTDDSWVATMMARNPDADARLLEHHTMRHALTNVVGTRARTVVHVVEEPLRGGELLLLSTDGVHGVLDERWLAKLMSGSGDPQRAAESLVAAALRRGARDNCTAVVGRYSV